MKQRYLVIYIFLVLLLGSCSSEENSDVQTIPTTQTPVEIPILIEKLSVTTFDDSDLPTTYSIDFNYENGILKNMTQGNLRSDFSYDGEKITSVKRFTDGIQDDLATFTYDGNLLKSITSNALFAAKMEFNYLDNGTLSSRNLYYRTNSEPILYQTDVYQYRSGNIIENLNEANLLGQSSQLRHVYGYDMKNNPFKNMNKFFRLYFWNFETYCLVENNPISHKYFSPATEVNAYRDYRYEMIYNSDNFPTEIKKVDSLDNRLLSVIKIQYS